MASEEEDFKAVASDPANWFRKSRALRRKGDMAFWDLTEKADGAKEKPDEWARAMVDSIQIAQMLHGLALETAFKGVMLKKNPESIKFKMEKAREGDGEEARITEIGVPLNRGHDLVYLAEKAGLFDDPDLMGPEGEAPVIRKILEAITKSVNWGARYPAPRQQSDVGIRLEGVPRRAIGHYYLDFIGPVLDRLHKWHEDKSH